MGLLELVITVCTVAHPTLCEDQRPRVREQCNASAVRNGCASLHRAMDRRAPKWMAVRWHCEYPASEKT